MAYGDYIGAQMEAAEVETSMWSGPPACHAGLLAGIFGARNKRTHAGQEAGMAGLEARSTIRIGRLEQFTESFTRGAQAVMLLSRDIKARL